MHSLTAIARLILAVVTQRGMLLTRSVVIQRRNLQGAYRSCVLLATAVRASCLAWPTLLK
jgi:hypothetical protein